MERDRRMQELNNYIQCLSVTAPPLQSRPDAPPAACGTETEPLPPGCRAGSGAGRAGRSHAMRAGVNTLSLTLPTDVFP